MEFIITSRPEVGNCVGEPVNNMTLAGTHSASDMSKSWYSRGCGCFSCLCAAAFSEAVSTVLQGWEPGGNAIERTGKRLGEEAKDLTLRLPL